MSRASVGLAAALAAALSLAPAAWLAWHHPLSPALALLAVALSACATAWRPVAWPMWLLPLLPLVGFMPWTGWMVVEELDLLLLGVATGGFARWAVDALFQAPVGAAPPQPPAPVSLAWLWLLPLALSTLVAAWRGVADAGGLSLGWWHGYREPLNAVRLLKPLLLLLWLLPLWQRAMRQHPRAAERAVMLGMVGFLATVALGVWWERWAYTGLLDFSSDYRATGTFWEMHVGGAALDAALALSVPFAMVAMARARGRALAAAVLVVAGLGAYAALTTFSRVVYLGLPLGAVVVWWLGRRQSALQGVPMAPAAPWAAVLWAGATLALAAWLFPSGGYRGMLGLVGAAAVVLLCAEATRHLPARAWTRGLALGGAAVLAVAATTLLVPKGAYLAYALAAGAAIGLLAQAHRPGSGLTFPLGVGLVASMLAVLAGLVAVPVHWGGAEAWLPALASAAVLAAVWVGAAARGRPSWPLSWRWRGQMVATLALLAGLVGVFGGGDYMSQRFAAIADDSGGRVSHWSRALALLDSGDWWLGKGLGRFLANFSLNGRPDDQVGDYRLGPGPAGEGQVLILAAGLHTQGSGEMFRVSQRIALPPPGPLQAQLRIRADKPVELQIEVCEKQLLYGGHCRSRTQAVPQPDGGWHEMRFDLAGAPLSRGDLFAPRWIVFALALGTPGRRAELDAIELIGADGRALLVNGDFEAGMARWFASSERNHMPWHAKNLAVHLLFEQGWLGLGAALLAGGVALWRTSFGAARGHVLAPALAGGLVAFSVVGIGDSLLDMPRIAWTLWWLVAVALLLPAQAQAQAQARAGPGRPL